MLNFPSGNEQSRRSRSSRGEERTKHRPQKCAIAAQAEDLMLLWTLSGNGISTFRKLENLMKSKDDFDIRADCCQINKNILSRAIPKFS